MILCILQRNLQWAAVLILILPVFASAQNKQAEAENRGEATAPTVTLKTFSRMVTLEMVVKDSRGRHVTGLKPSDFQVSEQTPSQSRAKRRQKIAEFHEVTMANLAARSWTARGPSVSYRPLRNKSTLLDAWGRDQSCSRNSAGSSNATMRNWSREFPNRTRPAVAPFVFIGFRGLLCFRVADYTAKSPGFAGGAIVAFHARKRNA